MSRFFAALAEAQLRRPVWFILAAVALMAASVPFVMQLKIDTSMVAMLPEERPSVQDLETAEGRLRGAKTLTVAAESASGDTDALRRFIDALGERLRAIPQDDIGVIDTDVRAYQAFVEENRHLFVPLETLTELRDAIAEEARQERLRANPMYFDLEDEDESDTPDMEEVIDRLQARAERQQARFPDGYYQSEDGDLVVLFVRTEFSAEGTSTGTIIERVRQEVEVLDPASFAADVEVALAGDVIVQREEQAAITQELGIALAITLSGVLLIVLLYFRRFRSIPLLGLGLVPGTLMSFAIAALTVGQLNLTTAFLGSVLLGNGINPSIIWLARYFEERRDGQEPADALRTTHKAVLLATLVASGAAAAAYGSLIITDFRGFRDFGIIGGIGMVLSWISATVFLPPAAVLFERLRPLKIVGTRRAIPLTAPFAWLVRKAPGWVLIGSVLLTAASAALVAKAVADDPVEYDFRQLRSVRPEGSSPARAINGRVNQILSSSMQGRGIAMLARNAEDVPALMAELDARRGDGEVFDGYKSLENLLPQHTEAKLPVLAEIRRLLLELRPHTNDERRARIDEYLPAETISPPTLADIPDAAARLYTERDGSRGLVLVVEEAEAGSIWDGRYLIRWTEELREIRYADGVRPPLIGQAPIFADMIDAVYDDMPRAIGAALLVTILLALLGFRRVRDRLMALVALLLGVAWMAAAMALAGMRLHFLNFIAFPITFGNGVDYSVNVLRRFEVEGEKGDEPAMLDAVRHSGGAVLLCSLTTIIGYSSLYASANLAMNSFGLAMAISEVTCFVAAILTIPSFVVWTDRRRRAKASGKAASNEAASNKEES